MSTSAKKMIALVSSDGERFEVEETVALQSETIKHMIEDAGWAADSAIPLPNVASKELAKVIEYCKRHAGDDKDDHGDLKDDQFDNEFVKVDQASLSDLILAANYLNIKSLLDLTSSETLAGDFTPEEEDNVDYDSDSSTSSEEECTSHEDEPSLIGDFIDAMSVEVWARNVSKEEEVVEILKEFLETLSNNSQHNALQHFDKVKKVFENHHFIRILTKVGCCTYTKVLYLRFAGGDLAEFLYLKMRRDPSFRKIFKSNAPVKLMRNALSILVGYWSNRNLLSLLVCSTGNSVLFGGEEEIPVATNTITGFCEDETINGLAERLSKVPSAVTLAKKLLDSIREEPPVGNIKERNYYHESQFDAACKFWYNPVIVAEIIKAFNESTGLLNAFKKYSRGAQLWRCEERMARIKRDPSLQTILEGDQALQIRGALSILIGYWNAKDVVEVFSSLHSVKSTAPTLDLYEGDVEVFEYLIGCRGDVEALKNVLADKYPRNSAAFFDRFDEIWDKQQAHELPEVFDDFLGHITVVLKNGRVIHFQMDPMPCVDKKQEECTSHEDEPSLIDNFVDDKCVKVWARNVSKEEEVVEILKEFLETLSDNSQHNALQHFDNVKKLFENHLFIRILSKVGCWTYPRELYFYIAGRDLAEFLNLKMRRDPSFRKIFKSKAPVKLMRNALSILVGYWSNRHMLSLLACSTGNSVLFGGEEEIPVATNTIKGFFEDETMNGLAERLSEVPKAVTLAKEFLDSIRKKPPVEKSNYYYNRQFDAVCDFWYDPVIVAEIIKALNESTGLLNTFKKYSRGAQLWRCEERMARIKRDPSLRTILEGDQELQIRGALSTLIVYWNSPDVDEVFSSLHSVKSTAPTLDLSGGDVEVFEYLIRWIGDVKALKNVLADKHPRNSAAFLNRFDEIWDKQQAHELPDEVLPDEVFDDFLGYITVVLKNGRVIHFQMGRMPCVDEETDEEVSCLEYE